MDKIIKRINELSALARTRPLTDDEQRERAELRARYIHAFKSNLEAQLDSTYIVTPDGKKTKLQKKNNKSRLS